MVHANPSVVPGPADELSTRTLPTFFGVLDLLLKAGVTTVAEAAFQDRLWRPGLEPLRDLARIRIVHCVVDEEVALMRVRRRWQENPVRRAHGAPKAYQAFDRVSVDAPWMEVDTTNGYEPGLDQLVAFINS